MDISVDWLALIVSVVAIALGIRESKLNHSTILQVIEIKCSYRTELGINNENGFYDLNLIVRNYGIPLHSPTFHLHYFRPGWGKMQVQFMLVKGEQGEMAKGMFAEISLRSYIYEDRFSQPFEHLEDVFKQNASLYIRSQGYLAYVIRFGTKWERFKRWWNGIASKTNYKFMKIYKKDGQDVVKIPKYLPYFFSMSGEVQQFADNMRKKDQALEPSPNSSQHPQ